jgi:hypothetical protein
MPLANPEPFPVIPELYKEVDGAPELCFRGFLHLHETVKKMIFRREVDHQVDVAGRGLLATSY